MTITATVLHPGYIMEEINRVTLRPRYDELCRVLFEWHEMGFHDHGEPPPQIASALHELRELKLNAFEQAGRRYRMALEAWEQRLDWERAMRRAGLPVLPDTAIQYVDGPKGPTELNFEHPA